MMLTSIESTNYTTRYMVLMGCLDPLTACIPFEKCPKAWAGSYKGKENTCSNVLESISDDHMFFWHASYWYADTLNNKTIFDLLPFQQCLLDGLFKDNEKSSGIVSFKVLGEEFNKMFLLVDGIYMNFSRFVKGIKIPLTNEEEQYTKWQEAGRKDIECAFGNSKFFGNLCVVLLKFGALIILQIKSQLL